MNNKFLNITAIVAAYLVANGAFAQDNLGSEVVNVVRTYTPTISDAFKVKETPTFDDQETNKKEEINYNIYSFPVASTFTPDKGKAANVERAKKEKFFSNYATLGIGNYTTILGELFLTHQIDNNQYIGGLIKHNSSQGGIKDLKLDDHFFDTSADLFYGLKQNSYAFTADMGYRNRVYNWYGLPQQIIDLGNEVVSGIDAAHTFHSFDLGGKLTLNNSAFNDVSLQYNRFWDAQNSAENRLVIKPNFDVEIANSKIKVNAIVDYVGTNFERGYFLDTESKYSFFNVGLQPSIFYQKDDLSLQAGAGLFYSMGKVLEESQNKFFVYPQIKASYRLVGDLMIAYAGAEGALQQNSYANFVQNNPFVSPTLAINPTDKQYDVYVGVKGKLDSNVSFNLKGSYISEKNKSLFYNNEINMMNTNQEGYAFGNSLGVLYDDVKTLGFFAELKADLSNDVSIGINGNYDNYSSSNQQEAWHLPNLKLNLFADAMITDNWNVGASIFYVGERKALSNFVDALGESDSSIVNLKGYFDANLYVNYKFTDRWTFFGKLNNIANQDYQKWLNYPVQGFQVMVGANYKFDF